MFRLRSNNLTFSSLRWLLSATLLLPIVPFLVPLRSEAHQVEISGDVGGTMHIEPNDSPRAGTASRTWFALNRRGGSPVQLADCNCSVAVYAAPRSSGDSPIQQPALSAFSAEGNSGVPSANITFPRAGAYEVVLKGQPKTAGAFSAFELRFSVTVAQ
ncbi:hypothetical protein IFO70_19195 [Phormidium tenue FACHB-886]|nr:hypothetical protein [Phormidium tenue FACHB-886]